MQTGTIDTLVTGAFVAVVAIAAFRTTTFSGLQDALIVRTDGTRTR